QQLDGGLEATFSSRDAGHVQARGVLRSLQTGALAVEPGVEPAAVIRGDTLQKRADVQLEGRGAVYRSQGSPESLHIRFDGPAQRVRRDLQLGIQPQVERQLPRSVEELPEVTPGAGLVGVRPEEQHQPIPSYPTPVVRQVC